MNSEDSYSTGTPRENRSFQELFYTPRPQVAITCYPKIGTDRLQRLGDRLARYNWQLVDGEPADAATILATSARSIAGGAK
ncbi:hypothetical protein [Microcoleus sp. FACHB-68]|uniref:hypothetical protein n=1 Tax=Microcoleus sp. FACHB-68 TaxID=2692826 RepID=UPI001685E02D|nr:hypothetical protein [Microcoleus sp. FACHB-68]MBD1939725.1 hypothetical protein [Microcoleus sp. FACHB-68]